MAKGSQFESRLGQEFFSFHVVQTGSGVQPASYRVGAGSTLSPGVKRPGSEADHSPPSSAEVKNGGAISPFPHTSSLRY
jgi:hypothetical protein